jgi:hypothetical protein
VPAEEGINVGPLNILSRERYSQPAVVGFLRLQGNLLIAGYSKSASKSAHAGATSAFLLLSAAILIFQFNLLRKIAALDVENLWIFCTKFIAEVFYQTVL